MNRFVRLGLGLCVMLLALCGVLEAIRLAGAEVLCRKDTLTDLRAATRWTPGDADIYARMAVLDSARRDDLRMALELNPRNPSWWITQSIYQEQDGDLSAAERSLLAANAVSRYYTPRWSLAAFYYRHGNQREFAHWANLAMSAGAGPPDSLFQMAERLGLPPDRILDDVIPAMPQQIETYLYRVLAQGRIQTELRAARRLIRCGSRENRYSVLSVCESAFESGMVDQAVGLWNAVIDAGWVARSRLEPATGRSLANDSFVAERWEPGFDWKVKTPPGVSISRSDADSSLCFQLSGLQPQACELITQFVPLLPNREYLMKIRYRLDSSNYAGGIKWSMVGIRSGNSLVEMDLDANGEFVERSSHFKTPARSEPAKILLSFSREPGTTRMEGRVRIQSVKLSLLP